MLDAGCLPLLHGVKKRRKCKLRKAEEPIVDFDAEEVIEESSEQGTSADKKEEKRLKTVTPKEDSVEEVPVKRIRRVSRQLPAVMVRPLPPYYCEFFISISNSTITIQIHVPRNLLNRNHITSPVIINNNFILIRTSLTTTTQQNTKVTKCIIIKYLTMKNSFWRTSKMSLTILSSDSIYPC